jgi:hypothetical protein
VTVWAPLLGDRDLIDATWIDDGDRRMQTRGPDEFHFDTKPGQCGRPSTHSLQHVRGALCGGERGAGQWRRASWDEALDCIAGATPSVAAPAMVSLSKKGES